MSTFSADPAHLIPANTNLRRSRRVWRVLFFIALAVAVLVAVGRFALPGEVADAVDFLCQVRRMEGFLVPGGEDLGRNLGCVWLTNGFV